MTAPTDHAALRDRIAWAYLFWCEAGFQSEETIRQWVADDHESENGGSWGNAFDEGLSLADAVLAVIQADRAALLAAKQAAAGEAEKQTRRARRANQRADAVEKLKAYQRARADSLEQDRDAARRAAEKQARRADASEADRAALAETVERLEAEVAHLKGALKPFAKLADTWTVRAAFQAGELLTVSNGQRMCGIKAEAFVSAQNALAQGADHDSRN